MQTARRLVKGPDTAETSERHLALQLNERYKYCHISIVNANCL